VAWIPTTINIASAVVTFGVATFSTLHHRFKENYLKLSPPELLSCRILDPY
jgi:hypothetical protein